MAASRRHQLLDDAWQEATLQIWRKLPGFRGEANICTWMYRVAELTASGYSRPDKRWVAMTTDLAQANDNAASDSGRSDSAALDATVARRLIVELQRISEQQAKALVLVDMLGHEYSSAAALLDINPKSVPNLLFRARANARKLLTAWGIE